MFRRRCAAKPTGSSRRAQANKGWDFGVPWSAVPWHRFGTKAVASYRTPKHIRDISHRSNLNLSRKFYEILKIVLDRLRFDRIISHTQAGKLFGFDFETWPGWCVYLFGLIFTRIRAARMNRREVDDSHALLSHPDLPDTFPLRFAPLVPVGTGGVPLFKALLQTFPVPSLRPRLVSPDQSCAQRAVHTGSRPSPSHSAF
jgi:hypothetical protein